MSDLLKLPYTAMPTAQRLAPALGSTHLHWEFKQ